MPRWVRDAHTNQPLLQEDNGHVHVKDFDGAIKTVPIAEASKLLKDPVSGFSAATADDINKSIEDRELGIEAGKTSAFGAAARHAAVGVAGAVLAPSKLVSGLGSAALGVEDPLAKLSGRQVYQDVSAIGAHVTGGESEVAAREAREQILRDEALHPVASTAGELGGNIAGGAAFGGGLAAVGGRAAAAAGLAGRAASIASGVGSSLIEGAGLGASAAAEEAWINNSKLTAEQTLAGIGLGALFGGGSTLAFAGAAKGIPSLAKALRRAPAAAEGLEAAAARVEAKAAEEGAVLAAGEKAATSPIDAMPDTFSGRARKWLTGISDEARVESIARGSKPAMKKLGGGEMPSAEEIRESGKVLHEMGVTGTSDREMLEQVTTGRKVAGEKIGAVLDNLDATAGAEAAPRVENILNDVKARARSMRENAIVGKQRAIADQLENELAPTMEKFEARKAWSKDAKLTIRDAYNLVSKLDASPSQSIRNYAGTLRASVAEAGKALEGGFADATHLTPISELVGKLTSAPSAPMREAASALLARIDDVASKADAAPRMGFRDLHSLRAALDDVAFDSTAVSKTMRKELQSVRGLIEQEITRAIEAKDPQALAEYTLNKKRYAVSGWAEDALGDRVNGADRANRKLSLTDYKAGIGATIAAAGGGLAAAPIGLATAVGHKILRERGWSTFATLARKAAGESVNVGAAPAGAMTTARNLQTLVAHAEERLNSGIGRFLGTGEHSAKSIIKRGAVNAALRSENLDEARAAYQEHARQVQEMATMPEVAASRISALAGNTLPTVAPGLHGEMVQQAARAASYLAAHMPAPPTDPDSITPQLDEPPTASHSDIGRYADRVEGVEDPLSLLDDLAAGRVSPEKVDAVKNAWPGVFERIQQTVFLNLAQRTKEQGPVPHEQRVLLDLAIDANGAIEPSLKRSRLSVMKKVRDSIGAERPMSRMGGPVPQLSKMFETRSSRIAMR